MRSLSIAATGMMAQQLHVEVISNDIANMTTSGYKRRRRSSRICSIRASAGSALRARTSAPSCRRACRSGSASSRPRILERQEVRVNFEVRDLYVAGVDRPVDITPDNQIRHDQIAELRVAYGGRGQITDVQQPRYCAQVLAIILPY